MPIECKFDPERSLLVCTVTGELTFDQVLDIQEGYLEKYLAENFILDLSLALTKKLETRDVEAIVDRSEMRKEFRRKNSKSAIVATSPLTTGFSRMYAIFFELKEMPWQLSIFESMNEALEWIGLDDMTGPEDTFQSAPVHKGVCRFNCVL